MDNDTSRKAPSEAGRSAPHDVSRHVFESQVFKAAQAVMASQAAKLLFRAVQTLLIARMLSPDDYGVFGMALVVYIFLYSLRDFGLSTIAISRRELSPKLQATLGWLTLSIGISLCFVLCVCASSVAGWYSDARLVPVLKELSVCFILNGLATPAQIALSRDLKFKALSLIDAASAFGSIVVAIAFAGFGFGYWSLVHMSVAAELFRSIGLIACTGLHVSVPKIERETFVLLRKGAGLAGFSAVNYIATSSDQFLVGLWFGSIATGLYGRAAQFTLIPSHFLLGPLAAWMVAALSRMRDDHERYRALNSQVTNAIAHLVFPLAAAFLAAPTPAIVLLLGPKWASGGPILRCLAIGLLSQPLLFAQNWLLMSQERGARLFVLAWANFILLLGLCFVFRPEGPNGIALAASLSSLVVACLILWSTRGLELSVWKDLIAPQATPLLSAGILAAFLWIVFSSGLASQQHPVTGFAIGLGAWSLLALLWKRARTQIFVAFRMFASGSGNLRQ